MPGDSMETANCFISCMLIHKEMKGLTVLGILTGDGTGMAHSSTNSLFMDGNLVSPVEVVNWS